MIDMHQKVCETGSENRGLGLYQGDVGAAGPPGPIGETGLGIPGPKVNTAVFISCVYCRSLKCMFV